MTGDLIKRDSIRVDVALYMASNAYLNDTALDVLKMIDKWLCEAEAVDAVEVVRCKDCMFFQPYEGEEHKGDCEELVGLESCVYEDDFCSYGRKLVKKDAVD